MSHLFILHYLSLSLDINFYIETYFFYNNTKITDSQVAQNYNIKNPTCSSIRFHWNHPFEETLYFFIHFYFTHMSFTISVLFGCPSNFIFYFCLLFLVSPYFLIYREFIRSANLTLKAPKSWTFPQSLITIGRFLPSFFNYWLLFIVFIVPFHLAFNYSPLSFWLSVFLLYLSILTWQSPVYLN
jgi:hypothetical protein